MSKCTRFFTDLGRTCGVEGQCGCGPTTRTLPSVRLVATPPSARRPEFRDRGGLSRLDHQPAISAMVIGASPRGRTASRRRPVMRRLAMCRVRTASGTSTLDRIAAADNSAGRRLTTRPIIADSRTSGVTRRRRNAAKRANAAGSSRGAVGERRENCRVLQSLAAALTQVRPHRVGGVPDEHHRPARPDIGWPAVVDVVPQDHRGVGRRKDIGHRLAHDAYRRRRYRSSPSAADAPSGARSVANQ